MVLERGSRKRLKRVMDSYAQYADSSSMEIVEESVHAERQEAEKRAREAERRARDELREQQEMLYALALASDRKKEEEQEQKKRLRQSPEARAKLFDRLFAKGNPMYQPCLERVHVALRL